MKSKIFYILKTILVAFLIWFVLTGIFVFLDTYWGFTKRINWLPIIFVLLPILVSASYITCTILKSRPPKEQDKSYRQGSQSSTPKSSTSLLKLTSPDTKPNQCLTGLARIDKMEGHEFEQFTANLLRKLGYERVQVTRGSGDQGVDIIAHKGGMKYAIQCKRYNQKLGNKPIQEVHTGKTIYKCDIAVVMTNNYFTPGAIEAARATGVQLWDRTVLQKMLNESSKANQ